MSKTLALALVLVFLTASSIIVVLPVSGAILENTWVEKAPMHETRYYCGVATVNGKIYAIGGGSSITNSVEEYNPANDTWSYKASMPTPRLNFATAVYHDKVYCIGGSRGSSSDTIDNVTGVNEVYDPATDRWETKTPMPTPRRIFTTAHVVDGKIYVIGQYLNSTTQKQVFSNLNEVYDPETDTWTTKSPMPIATTEFSGVFNNKIYFFGGYSDRSNPPNIYHRTLTQIYDPATDTWSSGTPPPKEIYTAAVGVTIGIMAPKRMYVFGGKFNLVYDPELDSWTSGAAFPTGRGYFAVAVLDDVIYIIGGISISYEEGPQGAPGVSTYYATVEAYTPFGYGTIPPVINLTYPENANYTSSEVTLNFTVNRPVEWTSYSLDGQNNVTVTSNTTLTGLAVGLHNVTVYALDKYGNIGATETINFTVAVPVPEPEPFPTAPVAAASIASVAAISAILLVYFKKHKHK